MPLQGDSRASASVPAASLRVSIQQPALAKYRIPVFRALASRPGLRVRVVYGQEPGLTNVAADGFEAEFSHTSTRRVLGRTLRWSGPQVALASRKESDVLVLTWNLNYLSLIPALLKARALGVPTILWGHGYAKRDRWYRRGPRNMVARLATALLFYNHSTRGQFVAAGFDPRRCFVAQNALDERPIFAAAEDWRSRPVDLAAFRRQHGLEERKVVLFVSRITPKTRLDVLLDAAVRLRQSVPELAVAVVGGGDVARLQSQVDERGLGDIVRLVGPIYDEHLLAPWFLTASAFCYPASIGLSIIHAFAYGLPVVTSDDRDQQNPEIEALRAGENGLLYRDGDAEDLAQALSGLLADPSRRATMGEAARRSVTQSFNIQTMVDGFEAAIRHAARMTDKKRQRRGGAN